MERVIDTCESLTGWTADTGVALELCEWPDLISGNGVASIMAKISAGTAGRGFGKTFSPAISSTGAAELVASLISRWKASGEITKASEANYAIDVTHGTGTVTRFYVPAFRDMAHVEIPMDGIGNITKLKVIALHTGTDAVVLSNARLVTDEMPLDMLLATKGGIESEIHSLIGDGIGIGTATLVSGSLEATINTDWSFVERYAVLRFVGTGIDETHQIINAVGNVVQFGTLYDGKTILNSGAVTVSIVVPVEVGRYDREIVLPGVLVWYSGPTPEPRTNRIEERVRSASDTALFTKRDGLSVLWRITLNNDARSAELVAIITQAIRNFLGKSVLWVHGKKLWFEWKEPAASVEPTEAYDIVPNSAYSIDIQIKEETWQRKRVTKSSAATLTIVPENA
jgi:hypothetical protein